MSDREPKLERAWLHAVVLILVSAPVVAFIWAVGYAICLVADPSDDVLLSLTVFAVNGVVGTLVGYFALPLLSRVVEALVPARRFG